MNVRIRSKRYFSSEQKTLKLPLDSHLEWISQEVIGPNIVRLTLRTDDNVMLTCQLFLSEARRLLKCI